MKLDILRIFDNPKFLINTLSKLSKFFESSVSISSYLPNLNRCLKLVLDAHFLYIFKNTLSIHKVSKPETFFTSVLGKIAQSPNSNANPKPNLDHDREGGFSLGAIFRNPFTSYYINQFEF